MFVCFTSYEEQGNKSVTGQHGDLGHVEPKRQSGKHVGFPALSPLPTTCGSVGEFFSHMDSGFSCLLSEAKIAHLLELL